MRLALHIDVINASPSALAMYELAAANNVPITVQAGEGTYYSPHPNSSINAPNGDIVIDGAPMDQGQYDASINAQIANGVQAMNTLLSIANFGNLSDIQKAGVLLGAFDTVSGWAITPSVNSVRSAKRAFRSEGTLRAQINVGSSLSSVAQPDTFRTPLHQA